MLRSWAARSEEGLVEAAVVALIADFAVETETGYHIFYRRPAPPQATVCGRHIVIAHDNAPWIELAARGEVPRRSRQDAMALALGLYERARKRPDEFERLVAEYSEHRDATRGGDFGT